VFSHCTVGRKIGIPFQRSDIVPAGTPKRRLSKWGKGIPELDKSSVWGAKSLFARKNRGSVRVQSDWDRATTVIELQVASCDLEASLAVCDSKNAGI
jgi:hypothetical protein